jgi:AbrB family looped-hinge helix DNA binding protein
MVNWQYKELRRVFIMETTLDKFGRIVIPKKIREDFNLRPGSPIRIEEGKGEILLKPIEGEPTLVEKDGVLVFTGIPLEDIENHIDTTRQQRSRLLRGF